MSSFGQENLRTPFWGLLVSVCLFGVTICQLWTYANNNRDSWHIRVLVGTLCALDFANLILSAEIVAYYAIEHWGDVDAASLNLLYSFILLNITVTIVFLVQMFFASRIFILSRRNYAATGLVVIFAIVALVLGVVSGVTTRPQISMLDRFSPSLEIISGLAHGFAVLCDVAVTVMLSRLLLGSKTGFKRTNAVIHKLLYYVVTRGVLALASQIGFLIVTILKPSALDWTTVAFCMGRIYIITMLMMLNARPDLKDQLNRDQVTDGEMMFTSSSGVHSSPIVVNTDAARRDSIRLEILTDKVGLAM
ncbi:hypothetical protein C8J56DRAFT_921365 [Mycena floridula]|nr:hypothetical protein C8J56DRAFT_921365 [Mycena floridula]